MSTRHNLRLLRRARRQAKRQLRHLTELEITGLTAVTLHARTRQVTVTFVSPTGSPFTDVLREALHERRQTLQREAAQLLAAWLADEQLRVRAEPGTGPPAA